MSFKVLLYTEFEKLQRESGLGKAIRHQEQALKENKIKYTLNKKDDFDFSDFLEYTQNKTAKGTNVIFKS